jgi:putative ABC transport system permease protein
VNAAVLSALASHWRRNPLQLITLLAGLALATALWSGVQAINAEARASYDAAAATLGEGQFAQITGRDGAAIPQQTYIALRRAGWLVSPVIGAFPMLSLLIAHALEKTLGVGLGEAGEILGETGRLIVG